MVREDNTLIVPELGELPVTETMLADDALQNALNILAAQKLFTKAENRTKKDGISIAME